MTTQNHSQGFVQSCITSVSFPETLKAIQSMVQKNQYKGNWLTDMDTLLNFHREDDTFWTAPRWMTQGDILFFYHTKKAKVRATALYQQAIQEYGGHNHLTHLLRRATETANQYAGTIFGCSEVAGPTEYLKSKLYHFDSRFFAPLEQFHVFTYPLPAERFADHVKIGQNTTTPLYGRQFDGIKALLAAQNKLPDFLQNARFGELSFRTVNQDNWPAISCAPTARFIHEAQIRAYLLDYLLNEIKDKGTPLLEECQCYRNGEKTGIVDYFIRVQGRWIPVEAKLNILAGKDILSQVAKYVQIDSFIPTKGTNRKKQFEASKSTVCIIADQSGIYVVLDGQFFKCDCSMLLWQRDTLNHSTVLDIRNWLQDNCPSEHPKDNV